MLGRYIADLCMWLCKEACFLYSRSDSAKLIPPLCASKARRGKEENFINQGGNLAFTTHSFHTNMQPTPNQSSIQTEWSLIPFKQRFVSVCAIWCWVLQQQHWPNVCSKGREGLCTHLYIYIDRFKAHCHIRHINKTILIVSIDRGRYQRSHIAASIKVDSNPFFHR